MEKTRKQILLGSLGAGFVVISIGVATLLGSHHSVHQQPEPPRHPSAVEITAPQVNVQRLPAERDKYAQLITKLIDDLDRLRDRQHQVDDRLAALSQGREQLGQGELELSPESEAVALTPEEEHQQIAEQTQAQLELMEAIVLTEAVDPKWAPEAQQALSETFRQEEFSGMYLVDADCRTSLCRMELVFDETLVLEDGFRMLTHNSPWQGEGFVRIGTEEDPSIMMFLAREGHSLPQAFE